MHHIVKLWIGASFNCWNVFLFTWSDCNFLIWSACVQWYAELVLTYEQRVHFTQEAQASVRYLRLNNYQVSDQQSPIKQASEIKLLVVWTTSVGWLSIPWDWGTFGTKTKSLPWPSPGRGTGSDVEPTSWPGTNSSKRNAKGTPRAKFLGQVWLRPELRSRLTTWHMFSHQKPTKGLGPKHFKAHTWWTCDLGKAYVPPLSAHHPYCTNSASGGVGWQDNIK
jgi:hypothetical protein